ncbi:MAG TPA: cytochrome b/b6 domain-containing protein [Reyranella sp.]|nr:cytochrome b/b6 domain-containing protein [Reyranella sp.]
MQRDSQGGTIRVWDLPVRLFHWTLVTLMVVSYVTGRAGGDWMKFHFWSGYGILTLLIFRILWGFVGSTTARFTHFVRGPAAAIAHLRELLGKDGPHDAGHNPAGAAMVLVLIFATLLQVLTGFFSADTDEGTVSGPLTRLASDKFIDQATKIHHLWINLLLVLVALHVLAALVYLVWKRQNLIGAMITGRKPHDHVVPSGEAAPTLAFASGWLALVLLAVSAAAVYGIVHLGG